MTQESGRPKDRSAMMSKKMAMESATSAKNPKPRDVSGFSSPANELS